LPQLGQTTVREVDTNVSAETFDPAIIIKLMAQKTIARMGVTPENLKRLEN